MFTDTILRRLGISAAVLSASISGCGVVICGGPGGSDCPPGSFCQFLVGDCGEAGLPGVCEPQPEACILVFDPVCGCDGRTYGNECEASAAGASVRSRGECPDDGEVCGGITGEPCDEGEFCKLPDGMCCCDIQGVCTGVPEACTDEFNPVCGCDGETYSNECEASAAGASVEHQGECDGAGPG